MACHWDIEYPNCFVTGKPSCHVFVLRGYRNKEDSKYFTVTTVVMQDDGLWEMTAWQTSDHAPKGYQIEGITKLLDMGLRISATFETKRLPAFKRMFRSHFKLETLALKEKEYNGTMIKFNYIEFLKL